MEKEDKFFCTICGKEIENPRANSKTCCDPECQRKRRIATTREKQIERAQEDAQYIANRNRISNASYHRKMNRISKLEQMVLEYKAKELTSKLKDTYFAGGCGGENLDKLLDVVVSVISDVNTIDDAIESLDNAETL